MTKKHFKALADLLACARAPMQEIAAEAVSKKLAGEEPDQTEICLAVGGEAMRQQLAILIAKYCQTQNENFDCAKFMRAAGVPDEAGRIAMHQQVRQMMAEATRSN